MRIIQNKFVEIFCYSYLIVFVSGIDDDKNKDKTVTNDTNNKVINKMLVIQIKNAQLRVMNNKNLSEKIQIQNELLTGLEK